MGINALTNLEVRRQLPAAVLVPAGAAAEMQLVPAQAAAGAEGEEGARQSQIGSALELLTRYIPTEVITLYVAAVSSAQILPDKTLPSVVVYWGFGIVTPVFLVLVLMNKQATAGLNPIPNPWPWWRMIAATIAFLVWALAVPGNPYVTTDALHVLAGFGAIFISTILGLLDPIFIRPAAS